MRHWFRSYWTEEGTWFYFEVDADGWVTRQVELQGPSAKPIAAASLAEWQAARTAGTLADCEKTFGAAAEVPVHEWDNHELHGLVLEEFETVWLAARTACQARARNRSASGA
ncbi:hypothetical protein RKD23_008033 [Streptomyces sp. SAI-170]|uniref:hypothetical protein n=1 Tax=Streptomyces sp. SAI-170 TaxID=3377729 RepID=UPI003C7EAD7F